MHMPTLDVLASAEYVGESPNSYMHVPTLDVLMFTAYIGEAKNP